MHINTGLYMHIHTHTIHTPYPEHLFALLGALLITKSKLCFASLLFRLVIITNDVRIVTYYSIFNCQPKTKKETSQQMRNV